MIGSIDTDVQQPTSRRRLLTAAGAAGLGAAAIGALGFPRDALAQSNRGGIDAAVLQFALQLEYLEAEFYLRAVGRGGVPASQGGNAPVNGGRPVNFQSDLIRSYAEEIASDELNHVVALRSALGRSVTPKPAIDLDGAFTAAARAAGLVGPNEQFDAFANDFTFLLASFIFEDVGVTAYKGAAPLLTNANVLSAAAGILAVEAYHAGIIRTSLASMGQNAINAANAISDARDSLDGRSDLDEGLMGGNVTANNGLNLVPTDRVSIAFSRNTSQVLRIVYLTPQTGVSQGGFFPNGVNGAITTT